MFSKKEKNVKRVIEKTPLEQADIKIKYAATAAFISAIVTFIFAWLSLSGKPLVFWIDQYALLDVAVLIVLGILMAVLRSRVAAIVLFIYFLASKAMIYMADPKSITSSIYMTVIFFMAYFNGITGAFDYQRIKKESKLEKREE